MKETNFVYSNTVFNILGYTLPLVVYFFSVPILVRLMGLEYFGILTLISVISNLLLFANFGFDGAALKFIPESLVKGEKDKVSKIINVNLLFYLAVGALIFLLSILFLLIFPKVPSYIFPPALVDGKAACLLAVGIFCVNIINLGIQTVLNGFQKFKSSNALSVVQTFLGYSTMVSLAAMGYDVLHVVLGNLAASFVVTILSLATLKKQFQPWSLKGNLFDKHVFKTNFAFGIYLFLGNLRNIFIFRVDKILLSGLYGPLALTYYSLPFQISERIYGFTGRLGSVLFPLVSELDAKRQKERMLHILYRSSKILMLIASIIAVTLIMFSREILAIWINPEFANNAYLALIILSLAFFMYCIDITSANFLKGKGLSRLVWKLDLVTGMISLAAILILTPLYGVVGCAFAMLIALSSRVVFPFALTKVYDLRFWSFFKDIYLRSILITALFSMIAISIRHRNGSFVALAATYAVYLAIMVLFGGLAWAELRMIILKTFNSTKEGLSLK